MGAGVAYWGCWRTGACGSLAMPRHIRCCPPQAGEELADDWELLAEEDGLMVQAAPKKKVYSSQFLMRFQARAPAARVRTHHRL